ncbi:MAG: hypothetical protein H7124_07935 [Phycisphaerales bacterium]|nr:hypothetical protein [Hyphomonadaceae bacterium]
MPLVSLTPEEQQVVRRAMAATFEFFDLDFQTRLGVYPDTMRQLLSEWPNIDDAYDSDAYLAINNAMNDLLHGVGISDAKATEITGADRAEMRRIYLKWAGDRRTGLL